MNASEHPLLTLAVAAYNIEKYVAECIDSLLCQQGECEILAVDDGSTDGTGKILDEYARRYRAVRVIHTPNAGVSCARNTAIEMCRGKYIWLIDGDDSIVPDAVEKLLPHLTRDIQMISFGKANHGVQNAEVFRNTYRVLDENAVFHLQRKNMYGDEDESVKKIMALGASYAIFQVDFLKSQKLYFYPGLRKSQDIVFNCMLFSRKPVAGYLDAPLYIYRPNAGSVSMRFISYAPTSYITVLEEIQKVIRSRYSGNPDMQALFYARVMWCVREALRSCYCHSDNPETYRARKNAFRAYLQTPVIHEGMKNVRMHDLSIIDKGFLTSIRLHLFWPMQMMVSLAERIIMNTLKQGKSIYRK